MRLILLGPPGSGKGTQAKLLSSRLDLVHISTGDILREAVRLALPEGVRAQPYIQGGQLVPDDVVNEIVASRFRRDDRPDHFVMDGYPRTLAQASSFEQVLRQQFLNLEVVVSVAADDEEIVRRLGGRWSCPHCKATFHIVSNPPKVAGICDVCGSELLQRGDDRVETVRERLRVYHSQTEGLIEHYRLLGILKEIKGEGDIEVVYQRIVGATNHVQPRT